MMGEVSSEIFENSKLLFKEMGNFSFLLKIIILFIVYLFSNYIFDRINNEDLIRTSPPSYSSLRDKKIVKLKSVR
jgi:hypothetical protein